MVRSVRPLITLKQLLTPVFNMFTSITISYRFILSTWKGKTNLFDSGHQGIDTDRYRLE